MLVAAPAAVSAAQDVKILRRAGTGRRSLACWLALPARITPLAPPIVSVHGISREAEDQARLLATRAAAVDLPVIAPVFDEATWPRYQQVVRGQRADLALLDLMNDMRLAGFWQTRTFDLAGFSGGAQFVHRFAMLYPHLVSRLTVTSAGWYTFPDEAVFPYGLRPHADSTNDWGSRMRSNLDLFLRLPIQVCVGALDNIPDPNTRSGPEIDRQQGPDRATRAARWAEAVRRAAEMRALEAKVTSIVLPACGHDFRACVERGGLDAVIVPDAACSSFIHNTVRDRSSH
ncbi:MAG: hypothetical protein AAGL24_09220 [Pseudomonadota bacterium]